MNEGKKGIPMNVILLGIVSFLNDVASEMVFPIVPIFLTNVLGVPTFIVGIVEGVADAASKIIMAWFGIISDRLQKRKIFVETGYAFATASHLIMSVASAWPIVLLARVINRAGKGIRTSARDAMITENSEKPQRGKSFGFHRTMDTMGGVVGPILSVILLILLKNQYRQLFLIAFVPAILGLILLWLFVSEKKKEPLGFKGMKFEWGKANESIKIFMLISFVFAVGNSSEAFMILRAQNLGLSVSLTIITYILFNFFYALFSEPAGIIADKIGGRKVLFSGFVLFALVYMAFGIISDKYWIWFLFPLYGVFMALTEGVSKAYISKLIPHEISASAFGIYQTVMGIGAFLSSAIAGLLWSFVSVRSPFYFGGMMALIAAGLFLLLTKRVRTIQPIA